MLMLTTSILFCSLFPIVSAFNFSHGTATQCDDLSLSWTGGSTPFYALLTPVRRALLHRRWNLQYYRPRCGLQLRAQYLVATVQVQLSYNNTDDPRSSESNRSFTFSGYSGAKQPVTILGVVPGGTSFVLNPPNGPTSYDWIANVFNGTSMLFSMFDSQGRNGGTSDLKIVGASDDKSCINSNSPSSTMTEGPTSTSGSDSSSSASPSSSDTPIGAIAGTVIGGLVFLAVAITLGLFFLRRRKSHSQDIRPWVDGTDGTDFQRHSQRLRTDFDYSGHSTAPLSEQFTPIPNSANPFTAPSEHDAESGVRRNSSYTHESSHPGTEVHPYTIQQSAGPSSTSAAQRKAAMAGVSTYKPSRYIVHTDAEDLPEEEPEQVVELPPAYTERKPR
ncbi:hypothetical protein V5O48_003277 [Marasmius crinis-equi]|uniref:Mid2 domain-containing protein n=1 Tax=Marasmius crinis-equi TaxID=585013 RepID=A0ABR3FT98_9AGAR